MNEYPARHHALLSNKLEEVSSGKTDRLMVLMPPGHAKSVYCSTLYPAWWFAQKELSRSAIICVSHTAELAESFGRRVRNLVYRERDILGYTLEADSKAAGRWETTLGGEYIASGIGGGITGRRADLIIIDDPVRSKAEAESERARQNTWDYYRSELYTRLKPGGRIILVMTRWHEDDLGGRLLDEMGSGGDDWQVLRLPALAEDPSTATEEQTIPPDPLGRFPGEALWPEWEDESALLRKRTTVGELDWSALFQQNPRPPKGVLFSVENIVPLTILPQMKSTVRSWDLASTAQFGGNNPDWTVGLKLGRTVDDRYVVMDIKRSRSSPNEILDLIVQTAVEDGRSTVIRLPEDPGQAGKSQISFYATKLAGYTLHIERETGAKTTRASPVISQVEARNVYTMDAPWRRAFIAELRDFPGGSKDDQVDALSGGFNLLGVRGNPMRISAAAVAQAGIRH